MSSKQQQIMASAREIIENKGMGGLTVARLSHRIGVSDGAIYRHFDSKMSIIKEILNELFYKVSDKMVAEISNKGPVKSKLKRIIDNLYGLFEEEPGYVSLLFSEEYFISDEEIFYLMHTIVNTMQLYIRQMLEQGIENKELKKDLNSQHMALLIMGSMRITVLNWRLKRNRQGLRKAGEALTEDLLKLMEH